jgi:DNA-binding NarL/FixJ family response regulator
MRESYVSLLMGRPNVRCTGFGSAEEAMHKLPRQVPHVLLLDIKLPGMSGIDLIPWVRSHHPATAILMLTVYDNGEHVFNALKAGAHGYVLKGGEIDGLVDAIHEVRAGGAPMSTSVARLVVASFRAKPQRDPELSSLTRTEAKVLDMLAQGHRYQAIADALFVSLSTVRSHVYNVYGKLHVHSRIEAVNRLRGGSDQH